MKKVFLFIAILSIISSGAKSQVGPQSWIVLNEINTTGGSQYVELYNPTDEIVNLSCYSLIIQTNTTTVSGLERGSFAVVDFKDNQEIPANGFYVIGSASPNQWTTKSDVRIYNYTQATSPYYTLSAATFNNTNDLLRNANSVTNVVLLVKNAALVDALVTKAQNVPDAQVFLKDSYELAHSLSSIPSNTCSGTGFNFLSYSNNLSNRNITMAAGQGAYARNGNGACQAWVKINDNEATQGLSNPTYAGNVAPYTPPSWGMLTYSYPLVPTTNNPATNTGNISVTSLNLAALQDNVQRININGVEGVEITVNFGNVNLQGEPSLTTNLSVYKDGSTNDLNTYGSLQVESDVEISSAIQTLTTGQLFSTTLFVPTPQQAQPAPYFYITMATPAGYCPFRSTYRISTAYALPVSLSKINVRSDNQKNNITWTTSTEQNNKGFEVQRAIGNTNDFKTIGFVGSRAKDGNSQLDINYNFEDANIVSGQTHYYRLKQIDFDGKSSLSPVRSIKPGSIESNLNVYPNPSQGSVTVNTGSTSGKLNIYVLDNTGRTVNQYLNVSTSNTRISNLKKGLYTLKIVNTETGEQSAQRVVVQ